MRFIIALLADSVAHNADADDDENREDGEKFVGILKKLSEAGERHAKGQSNHEQHEHRGVSARTSELFSKAAPEWTHTINDWTRQRRIAHAVFWGAGWIKDGVFTSR